MQNSSRVVAAASVAYLAAIAIWMGGLLVLGAIVAPTVFRNVPAPTSADAMILVFRRFDSVAIAAAFVALVAEAVLGLRGGKIARADVVRGGGVVLATVLLLVQAIRLSPANEALHRAGAVRGLAADGLELERSHRLAEACGKAELALLFSALVLLVVKLTRRSA
jgi:uncharacterized membrane protein